MQIDANDIAEELRRIGFADLSRIGQWSDKGFALKDSSELDPELTAAISEVAEIKHRDESTGVKVKMHDKLGALDRLAKILGLYRDVPDDNRSVAITQITVVLSHDKEETMEITEPAPQRVIDGESRTLPEESEDSQA